MKQFVVAFCGFLSLKAGSMWGVSTDSTGKADTCWLSLGTGAEVDGGSTLGLYLDTQEHRYNTVNSVCLPNYLVL